MTLEFTTISSPSDAGYYSGLLASSFYAGRVISILVWSWLADRYGRKPVILTWLFWLCILLNIFGMSTSLTWAIISRFLIGLTNPLHKISRICIIEISPESSTFKSLGCFSTFAELGTAIGPVIGAIFIVYPSQFDFDKYPYWPPNLILSSIVFVTLLLFLHIYEETLENQQAEYAPVSPTEEKDSVEQASAQDTELTASSKTVIDVYQGLVKDTNLVILTGIYSLDAFIASSIWELVPLLMWARTRDGGMGMQMIEISWILWISFMLIVVMQHCIYSWLVTKQGYIWTTKCAAFLLIPVIFAIPIPSRLTNYEIPMIALTVLVIVLFNLFHFFLATSIFVIITNSVPVDKRAHATDAVITFAAICQCFGPYVSSVIFAVSLNPASERANQHLVFIILWIIAGTLWTMTSRLPDALEWNPVVAKRLAEAKKTKWKKENIY